MIARWLNILISYFVLIYLQSIFNEIIYHLLRLFIRSRKENTVKLLGLIKKCTRASQGFLISPSQQVSYTNDLMTFGKRGA